MSADLREGTEIALNPIGNRVARSLNLEKAVGTTEHTNHTKTEGVEKNFLFTRWVIEI